MKKLIILSDTHKNQKFLRKAFSNEDGITHILHLGDFYEDLDDNYDLTDNRILIKVPGIYHKGYREKTLPAINNIQIEGWNILMVHDISDIMYQKNQADIILYGHTHHWNFQQNNQQYIINPGHLKQEVHRGKQASYLILKVKPEQIEAEFKDLNGNIFYSNTINR